MLVPEDWCRALFGPLIRSDGTRSWMCRLRKGHDGPHDNGVVVDGIEWVDYEAPTDQEVIDAIVSIRVAMGQLPAQGNVGP